MHSLISRQLLSRFWNISMTHTFLWHDYETFGLNTRRDRPAQFAGIRTDENLNIIEEPVMFYCKPTIDVLPDPTSCMVTGITPQTCLELGYNEHEFADKIEKLLGAPGTIGVGYNTIAYDDEITRFMFWRNLIDPYAREWQNNCGRWDIIDMARAAYSLRPDGVKWPTKEDGSPSFRLEDIAKENGLAHEAAHDALSDVYATIALAKLIKESNPKLFDYYFSLHKKDKVAEVIGLLSNEPFVHVSKNYGSDRGFLSPMMAMRLHPTNKNEVISWDLTKDPSELLTIDAETMSRRLFTKWQDRGEEFVKMPVVSIATNKSPMVIKSLKSLTPEVATRWGIDVNVAIANSKKLVEIMSQRDLGKLFADVYAREFEPSFDPEESLYGGAFLGRDDRRKLDSMRYANPASMGLVKFDDARLEELFFHYRARNFPNHLSIHETTRWNNHINSRLINGENGSRTIVQLKSEVDDLIVKNSGNPKKLEVLNKILEYSNGLISKSATRPLPPRL